MFIPRGFLAKEIDPAMLLNMWAHHIDQNRYPKMIFAGIGKPGFPINEDFVLAALTYWKEVYKKSLVSLSSAIDYGLPSGTPETLDLMAKGLTHWYNTPIEPKHILFTVGGCAGLRMIFRICNKTSPRKKIITTNPYYTFYNNQAHQNRFHFIDLLKSSDHRLTAKALKQSIHFVGVEGISAFLFCDPNNPLGTVIGEKEWKRIASVLEKTPASIPIIIDEAYAELCFGKKHVSLLSVAPQLKERLLILRSATKGFSASGERIAILVCFNPKWKAALEEETIFSYGHAPKSLQWAYADALSSFSTKKRKKLAFYYQEQVDFAQTRLRQMGPEIPLNIKRVEATFYVLANLSRLFGRPIPPEAKQALGEKNSISTDVELCYSLLFSERIMICPLSFFGVDPTLGYVRITCSNGLLEISQLMDRLERKLSSVAVYKNEKMSNL